MKNDYAAIKAIPASSCHVKRLNPGGTSGSQLGPSAPTANPLQHTR
jgi:hypothetical protein